MSTAEILTPGATGSPYDTYFEDLRIIKTPENDLFEIDTTLDQLSLNNHLRRELNDYNITKPYRHHLEDLYYDDPAVMTGYGHQLENNYNSARAYQSVGRLVMATTVEQPQTKLNLRSLLGPPPSSVLGNLAPGLNFLNLDLDRLKPEDLPELALPVLEFVERVQPDVVVGCDRGGRMFSLAVHAAWRATRPGKPFPTLDGKIHFTRISKTEDEEILSQKMGDIIQSAVTQGLQRGNKHDEGNLKILFIDDWVVGGGTKRLAERLAKAHGATAYFATMCGRGADVTGSTTRGTFSSWRDDPEEIGVNYISTLKSELDGGAHASLQPVPVRTDSARMNRKAIQHAASVLAKETQPTEQFTAAA